MSGFRKDCQGGIIRQPAMGISAAEGVAYDVRAETRFRLMTLAEPLSLPVAGR